MSENKFTEFVIAGVHFSQMFAIYFCEGFCRCPYYRGVRYSGVFTMRELTVFVIRTYSRRVLFLSKMGYKKGRGWNLGGASLYKTSVCTTLPPGPSVVGQFMMYEMR